MHSTADNNGHSLVIWQREIDEGALTERWKKLGLYYGVPLVLALVAALVLGGVGAFLGVLILLGVFGLMLAALVFLQNFNARANSSIELEGGELVWGRQRVELARIERWATEASAEDWGVGQAAFFGNPMAGNAITARVLFRLAMLDHAGHRAVRPDGGPAFEVVSFSWARMPSDHLHRLGTTLEPYVNAPRVAADQLRV